MSKYKKKAQNKIKMFKAIYVFVARKLNNRLPTIKYRTMGGNEQSFP